MNKKLLLGLLLVLLLLSCLAMADGCEICGDNPVFAEDTVAVAVDDQTHTKTCIHGVDYTFNTLTLPLKKEIINQIIITIGLNAQPVAKKSHTAVRIFPPVMN